MSLRNLYKKWFIEKGESEDYDSKKFIADSGATPNMVNTDEKTTNLKKSETGVTVGDSDILIRTQWGYCHG